MSLTLPCVVLLLSIISCGHSQDQPKAVLSVSPTWLPPTPPGASVTLNCEVNGSVADWTFYWYRAALGQEGNFVHFLLPGSLNGTTESSYVIPGPTGTGGYACRAKREDPVYYTDMSANQFVFSGDRHSSASLTVSPARTQHFINESVSLICEGKLYTEWTVMYFSEEGDWPIKCSFATSMTSCKVSSTTKISSVFWCQSGINAGTGEYSNAVNITVPSGSVILVSPVQPVIEGSAVTLQCKHRTEQTLSNVDFYRNGELVQTRTNGQMIIAAVSTCDEGFYKCTYAGEESTQSWMAVTFPESTRSAPPSITGSGGSALPSGTGPVENGSPLGLILRAPTLSIRQERDYDNIFKAINGKVPQEPLSSQTRCALSRELVSYDVLCDTLKFVELLLDVLSETGGDAKTSLEDYLRDLLKTEDQIDPRVLKALGRCHLNHCISLWQLLSSLKSQMLLFLNKEPFAGHSAEYREPLREEQERQLKDFVTKRNVGMWLLEMHEFILLRLGRPRTLSDYYPTWSVKESVKGYMDQVEWMQVEVSADVLDGFPDSILLSQAIEAWKSAVRAKQEWVKQCF